MESIAAQGKMKFPPTDYWTFAPEPWWVHYGKDPTRRFTRGGIRYVPADDDIVYTLLGLLAMEELGPDFTTEQTLRVLADAPALRLRRRHAALVNLRNGCGWKLAAERNNPYSESLGGDIRCDAWGYAAAGWPEEAAELAYRDAYVSHRHGGIYAAMFFAATIAAAFAVEDTLAACEIGLTEIPRTSRVYRAASWRSTRRERSRISVTHGNWPKRSSKACTAGTPSSTPP